MGDAELLKDVRQFAATLGFGSGAGDAAFDDFAPSKAAQKLGGKKEKRKQKEGEGGDAAAGGGGQREANGMQQTAAGRGKQSEQKHRQRQNGAAERRGKHPQQQQARPQRGGNAAPGEQQQRSGGGGGGVAAARSILPRDEPSVWHEAAARLPPLSKGAPAREAPPDVVEPRRAEAEALLRREEAAYEADVGRRRGQDARWLQEARRAGTTQDRVAAQALLVAEAGAANLRALDGLLAMVAKRGGARAVVGVALDAAKELFLTALLPDRKLRYFEQQPLGALGAGGAPLGPEAKRRLLYWLVEDGVKKRYAAFCEALEAVSRDNLEHLKDRATKALFELLRQKPEGEQRLLSALVNKLGDPDRKLASKVGHLLGRLLAEHPGMRLVVAREVERFVFRPNLADRARYYAVVYLNQMLLDHRPARGAAEGAIGVAAAVTAVGGAPASHLSDQTIGLVLATSSGLFIGSSFIIKKKGLRRAGTSGIRAAPASPGRARRAPDTVPPAPRTLPRAAPQAAAQAGEAQHSGELDARMLSALITGVRRAFPYVPPEEVEPLIEAHAGELFRLVHTRSFGVATQVAQEAPANFACGCLLITSELLKARPALWSAVLQTEDKESDAMERFADAPEEGEGEVAGAPRGAAPAPASGGRGAPRAAQRAAAAGEQGSESSDSEQEVGMGSDSDEEEGGSEGAGFAFQQQQQQRQQEHKGQDGWRAAARQQQEAAAGGVLWPTSAEAYDMRKRVVYEGDPLRDLTLATFLDKFVAKKPKARGKGDSAMQPLLREALAREGGGGAAAGLHGAAFASLAARDVAPDDAFFHAYYSLQARCSIRLRLCTGWGWRRQREGSLGGPVPGPAQALAEGGPNVQAKSAARARARKRKADEGDEALLSDEEGALGEEEESADEDAFLAGEEEGGDDGVGADPGEAPRPPAAGWAGPGGAGRRRDAAGGRRGSLLAAAMDSDEGSAGEGPEGLEGSEGSEEEEGEGEEEEEEGSGSGSDGGDGLRGAQFSDMSSEEEEEEQDDAGASHGEGGEERAASGDGEGGSGSERGAVAEDAEVDALVRRHGICPLPGVELGGAAGRRALRGKQRPREQQQEEEDSELEGLNPFELAEATSSSDEEAGGAAAGGRRREGGGGARERPAARDAAPCRKKRSKGGDGGDAVFASADDYAALIDRDMAADAGGNAPRAANQMEKEERPPHDAAVAASLSAPRRRHSAAAARQARWLTYTNAPPHTVDNRFILKGYRPQGTFRRNLRSLWQLHNETGNIWTHLIGFLIFLFLTATTWHILKPAPLDLSPRALLALEQRLFAAGKANLADLTVGSWERQVVALGQSRLEAVEERLRSIGRHNLEELQHLQLGAGLYAARVPERWKPGAFDVAFHSHQLFHIAVVVAACVHYKATQVLVAWRDATGGCPALPPTL
eukprot:scaffold25.g5084.t1